MTAGGPVPPDRVLPDWWGFDDSRHALIVAGDAAMAVIDELTALMPGWPTHRVQTRPPGATPLMIRHRDNGILLSGGPTPGEEWVPDTFSAAYHIAGRAFEVLAGAQPHGLVLHAGAIFTPDDASSGAIAFAGPSGTGKSCLGAAFALAGIRLLGDDRIVVSTSAAACQAHPLGLAQKLRLPLPEEIADRMAPLVSGRAARRFGDSLFLGRDPIIQAPRGAPVPLRQIFLLRRDGTAPAKTAPLSRPKSLRALLQLSAVPGGSARHLAAVRAVLERISVTPLQYGSCFDAERVILAACRVGDGATAGSCPGD